MKKLYIYIMIIFIIILVIFFLINNNKKNKSGNNTNNQILNMSSYEAKIEVTVKSNKNTNKYILKQRYKKGEYEIQEVEEPNSIKGVKMEFSDGKLKLQNTDLQLSKLYENYQYVAENNLFLNEFVENFKNNSDSTQELKDRKLVLTTKCRNKDNKYQAKKRLIINEKTKKPEKLEVQDINQNINVYILYNEISFK